MSPDDAVPLDETELMEDTIADTETTAAVRLGMLHTVPALAARFDADLVTAAPGSTAVHVVDANLLATAIATGVDDAVDAAVTAHVQHLAAAGVDAVLVTCSSIGESVEIAAATVDLPVVRVDAAMAARAIELAGSGRPHRGARHEHRDARSHGAAARTRRCGGDAAPVGAGRGGGGGRVRSSCRG